MAAVASTGPIDVENGRATEALSECCMNAVLNVPMETEVEVETGAVDTADGTDEDGTVDVAVLGEEVIHQLRRAGTPGGFSDLEKAHDAADAVDAIESADHR